MHKKDNFPRRWSTYVLLLLQEDVNTERPPLDDVVFQRAGTHAFRVHSRRALRNPNSFHTVARLI